MATETRIVTSEHAILSYTGAPSATLAPGEHVVFDPDNDAHKAIKAEIDAGRASHLSIVEVDTEAEQANKEETDRLIAELEERQRQENEAAMAKARVAAGQGQYNPEEYNVSDVLDYLRQASPEEVERVQALEARSDRASKQIADFEPREE